MIYFDYSKVNENKLCILLKPFILFILRLIFKIKVYGKNNIPEKGGFIIASNHVTVFDPFIIASCVENTIHFMAKSETFKNRFYAFLMRNLNAFPVKRGNRDRNAIDYSRKILNNGKILGIFPEGKLTKGSYVPSETKSGVALIAKLTGADVLPVCVYMEKGFTLRKKVTVRFGGVISNSELGLNIGKSSSQLKLAAEKIFNEIKKIWEEKHGSCAC